MFDKLRPSAGSVRGKTIAGVGVLILTLLLVRVAMRRPPQLPEPPRPAPVIQPSPVVSESRPAPPLKSAKKSLLKPVQKPKKVVATRESPQPRPTVLPVRPTPIPPGQQPVIPVLPPPPPEPRQWQGNDTSVTHVGQVVIHNDRQWIHFWSEHHPHEAAPDVDFNHDMVIGVFAGPRPAEQFTIRIVNVHVLPDSWVVDYGERLPPTGTFAVNVTVYPYYLKVVPRTTLPVKFNLLPPENVAR